MNEDTELTLRFLTVVALLPALVALSRRALGGRPAHLTDEETHSLRLLSFGGVGGVIAFATASFLPWQLNVVLSMWTAFAVVRIGSRLHLTNSLRARLAFGEVQVRDEPNARVACVTGQSWHPTTVDVARFLEVVAARGRTLTRTRLRDLPQRIADDLKAEGVPRERRRTASDDLTNFLLDARECGCLVLEPDTDDTEPATELDADPTEETSD